MYTVIEHLDKKMTTTDKQFLQFNSHRCQPTLFFFIIIIGMQKTLLDEC